VPPGSDTLILRPFSFPPLGSNSSVQRQATATGDSATHSQNPQQIGICPAEKQSVETQERVRQRLPTSRGLSQLSHELVGRHRTQALMLDNRWTMTSGYGLWRTGWTLSIDLRIRWRLLLSVVSLGGGCPRYVGFKQYAAYVGDIHNAD
jgi:hypothetical protein